MRLRCPPDGVPYVLVMLLTAAVAFTNLTNAPVFQDDEGTYTFQARSIWEGALAPYTYWYDHPPFGWIQLAAFGWMPDMLGLGGSAVGSMRYVIATYLVINTVLLYALGRRLGFHHAFAGVAVLFFVLSPLSLELGRQVFLDNIAMPWVLAGFLLALSPKHYLSAHVGAGVCFAIAVLTKETMAVYGPALLFVLYQNTHHRTRSFSLLGFLTIGGLVLSFYPLMALLKGELLPREDRSTLWEAILFQLVEREGSGYIWESGSSKAELVAGWAYFDAALLWGGLAAALALVLFRRYRWLTIVVASFSLPVVATQGYLPAMYIVAVLPFLALSLGAVGEQIWRTASMQYRSDRSTVVWLRRIGRGLTASGMAVVLWSVTMPSWEQHNTATLTQKKNSEWEQTVAWVTANLPRDAVVAVPPSMWQELRDAGWPDEWTVVSAEKVDLDPGEFQAEHPGGWRELDYVVLNPTVRANLDYLDLTQLRRAVDHGTPVFETGGTQVLRIDG